MLKIENVTAGYNSGPVLRELSLEVRPAERLAILGRNGVGKTTLLRAIIGEVNAQSGSVEFNGADVTSAPPHKRARAGIAYVPQGRDIFPGLSVIDNLKVAGLGAKNPDLAMDLQGVLDEFPVLREKGKLAGGGLSGGQQQILALGRALMTRPKLLLLDEPSEGIQPSIVTQIADHVRKINEERGITVIIIEQNLEFAMNVADQACLMDKGQIVLRLPAAEILENKDIQHEYLGV